MPAIWEMICAVFAALCKSELKRTLGLAFISASSRPILSASLIPLSSRGTSTQPLILSLSGPAFKAVEPCRMKSTGLVGPLYSLGPLIKSTALLRPRTAEGHGVNRRLLLLPLRVRLGQLHGDRLVNP